MPHIAPKSAEDLRDVKKVLKMSEAAMGFIPNSTLTMAHKPQLSLAFSLLAAVTYGADLKGLLAFYGDAIPEPSNPEQSLTPEQIQLLAFAVSLSAGCRYCQAHTSHRLVEAGANQEKLSAIADYEASAAFTPGEKALLALAFAAGQNPNEATSAHFTALKDHFSEEQIVQAVGVVSLFGFLNRWNDTMATTLEKAPMAFAKASLDVFSWAEGKHGPSEPGA